MVGALAFHPFIAHFPVALFVAGVFLACSKDAKRAAAGRFNLAAGFIAAVLALVTGFVAEDISPRGAVETGAHQDYSLAFVFLSGGSAGAAYAWPYSPRTWIVYAAGIVALGASAYSGYLLTTRP